MTKKTLDSYLPRKTEIALQFQQVLNSHVDDFMAGRIYKMHELKELADSMCIHPVHLSKVIKLETGHHACYHYEQRILKEVKELLSNSDLSINEIAHKMDYDNSNFTKFFKKFTGQTPSMYRKCLANNIAKQ